MSVSCADLIDERLNDSAYTVEMRVPVRKNGQLVSVHTERRVDHRKILHDVIKNKLWHRDSSFAISKSILKTDEHKLRGRSSYDDSPDEFAHKQLALFVAQLAKNRGHKSPTALRATLSQFWRHLNADLSNTTYISPLYNLTGDFSTIRLESNLHIRPVTEEEYSKIVKLQNVPTKEIDEYRKSLKFVLSCSMPGSSNKDLIQKAIDKYSFTISLLKLFRDGYPQFGRVYEVESEHVDVGTIDPMHQSYYENPTAFSKTRITKNEARRFEIFYTQVVKKLSDAKKSKFIRNSLARFSMAYVHRIPANKIVDYVISLEALLVPSSNESVCKLLAHRTAALYADTDAAMVETWEFIQQSYNFRSGIVHASKERKIKVGSTPIPIRDVELRLHKIAKESILRVLGLTGLYENHDAMLQALDRSIYDRSEMRQIRKAWRPFQSYCR